jgi:hypothetical protein
MLNVGEQTAEPWPKPAPADRNQERRSVGFYVKRALLGLGISVSATATTPKR